MSDPKQDQDLPTKKLHRSELSSVQAISSLGLHAAAQLGQYGMVCMYLDRDDFVQLARPGEHTLDALPEPEALHHLLAHGYTDQELEDYLRGRDARLSKR